MLICIWLVLFFFFFFGRMTGTVLLNLVKCLLHQNRFLVRGTILANQIPCRQGQNKITPSWPNVPYYANLSTKSFVVCLLLLICYISFTIHISFPFSHSCYIDCVVSPTHFDFLFVHILTFWIKVNEEMWGRGGEKFILDLFFNDK